MATLLNLNPLNNLENKSNNRQFNSSIFTKEGIRSVILKKPKAGQPPMRVRILPSFDFSLYGSEVFKSSVLPFKTPDFKSITDWAISVKGYTYFGDLWSHFLSPATMQPNLSFPRQYTDPVVDLRSFIFKGNKNGTTLSDGITPLINAEAMDLIKPDPVTRFVKLPAKPRDFVLMNALVENQETKQWDQEVLIITRQAFNLFCDILETRPRKSDPEITPGFEDYLFGDPTDPKTGCILEAREVTTDSNLKALTLCPSSDNKSLVGFLQKEIGEGEILSRYVLQDPENVLDIWSYQQILDKMCEDPMIPEDLLQLAFENNAFNSEAVLNLHLRQQGNEKLAKRQEAMNKKSGVGSMVSPTQPQFSTLAPKPTSGLMGKLASMSNTSSSVNGLGGSRLVNPTTIATNSVEVTPQEPVNPIVQQSPEQQTSQTADPNMSKLSPEEQKTYMQLLQKSTSGQALQTDEIQKYIELMQKIGQ